MCLNYSERATEDYRHKHKGQETVRVWKVLVSTGGALSGPLFGHEWKVGENVSSRRYCRLLHRERRDRVVDEGFHVFCRRGSALHCISYPWSMFCGKNKANLRVVCFTAKMSDLIGVSLEGWAVFAKLTLSRHAYNRAISKGGGGE